MALSVSVHNELSSRVDRTKSTIKSTLVCGDPKCPRIESNPVTVQDGLFCGFRDGEQIWIVHSGGPNEGKLCCQDCFKDEQKLRIRSLETLNSTSSEQFNEVDATMTKVSHAQTREQFERKTKELEKAVVQGRKHLSKWVEWVNRVELLKWGTSHDSKDRIDYKIADFEDEDEEEAKAMWRLARRTETYKAKREFHQKFPQHAKKYLGEQPNTKVINSAIAEAEEAEKTYKREKQKILELQGDVKDLKAQVRDIDQRVAGNGSDSHNNHPEGDADCNTQNGNEESEDSDSDDDELVDGKRKRKKGAPSKSVKKKKSNKPPPRTVPFYEKSDHDAFTATNESRTKKIKKQIETDAEKHRLEELDRSQTSVREEIEHHVEKIEDLTKKAKAGIDNMWRYIGDTLQLNEEQQMGWNNARKVELRKLKK